MTVVRAALPAAGVIVALAWSRCARRSRVLAACDSRRGIVETLPLATRNDPAASSTTCLAAWRRLRELAPTAVTDRRLIVPAQAVAPAEHLTRRIRCPVALTDSRLLARLGRPGPGCP